MNWFSFADASICRDPLLLSTLKKSRCVMLNIGFESLEADSLESMSPWKRRYLHRYTDAISEIRRYGMVVTGNFIIGYQRYDKDVLKRIRDFVIDEAVMSQYFIATPYPGTKFYDDAVKGGRLRKELDWRFYNAINLVHDIGMPPEDVAADLLWLYEQTWAPDVIEHIMRRAIEAARNAAEIPSRPKPRPRGRTAKRR